MRFTRARLPGASTKADSSGVQDQPGYVDECRGDVIVGWAQIPRVPAAPAIVDVMVDGEAAGSARANIFRQDLRDLGIRDGFAGFEFKLPERLCDGASHRLSVVERFTRKQLGGISDFQAAKVAPVTRSQLFLNSVVLSTNTDDESFARVLLQKKRLAVLCAFTPRNDLYAYHHRLIEWLQSAGYAVLLGQSYVSDEMLTPGGFVPPASKADACLVKENLGYDFGTWLACIVAVKQHMHDLDEVLLLNDSVFGPLGDFASFQARVSSLDGDVVGVCDSYEHNYHLQSFYLLFRKAVVRSGLLEQFADVYPYSNDKSRVIQEGELALTPALSGAGFSCRAVYPFETLAAEWLRRFPEYLAELKALPETAYLLESDGRHAGVEFLVNVANNLRRGEPTNPSHYFWDILIDLGCPFIKRELMFKNPIAHPMLYKAPGMLRDRGFSFDLVREAAQRFGTSRIFASPEK